MVLGIRDTAIEPRAATGKIRSPKGPGRDRHRGASDRNSLHHERFGVRAAWSVYRPEHGP